MENGTGGDAQGGNNLMQQPLMWNGDTEGSHGTASQLLQQAL